MDKLRLDVDDLEIESFESVEEKDAASGTLRGQGSVDFGCASKACDSDGYTCDYGAGCDDSGYGCDFVSDGCVYPTLEQTKCYQCVTS